MTIEQILAATDTLPNDTEIPIGTEKVKLGDLRSLTSRQMKDLSDKTAAAELREQQARDTAMKAANLLSSLEEAKSKLTEQKTKPAEEDDFQTAEWWKPVRDQLSARDKKIDEAIKGIDMLTKSVQQAATVWFKDRSRQQFRENAPRLKKVEQYKDWDENKVLNYATERKLVDDDGLPSVEKAIAELTKATELETIKKEAYEQGLKEGRTKARIADMPRPSSATGGKVPKGKSMVEEMGLEGLGDDVMNDAELMESLSQLKDIDTLQ